MTSKEYPIYEKNLSREKINQAETLAKRPLTPNILEDPIRESYDILSFISPVEKADGEIVAYIMNNMEERMIYYKYLDGLESSGGTEAVILDETGRVVSARNQGRVGNPDPQSAATQKYRDGVWIEKEDSTITVAYHTVFTGHCFRIETERSQVLSDLKRIRYFLMAILIGVFGAALVPSLWITRSMYQPLRDLMGTMELVGGGELAERVQVRTRDEIGRLSGEFNSMLDHMQGLIDQLVKEEMLKKNAELEALQYQITPHFMYNTLNSIKYAALLKGEKEIGGLIEDFVELLEASINKKGTFVTVAEELHFLEHYLKLQSVRYEEEIQTVWEVQPEAKSCFLPRLMLQPLVENAILHGMDMKNGNNRIKIGAKVEADVLCLYVQDNGRGMTKEQIDKFFTKNEKKTSGLSGIGAANVRERLHLYYGKAGSVAFESRQEGTKACIRLPAYKERDEYAL